MQDTEANEVPVQAKAFLVEPVFMTVLWMNDSALRDLSGKRTEGVLGLPIENVVPLAGHLGLAGAMQKAADTGNAQHRNVRLVSTGKGALGVAASVYRLPDGKLLLLMEQTFRMKGRRGES